MLSESVKKLIVSDAQREIDLKMVPYDLWGTRAHVLMLHETKIIDDERASKILGALQSIEEAYAQGDFKIDPELGAQLTLEREIVKRAGDVAGLSTHTARSRNDQIMVTELLYLRDEALSFLALAEQLLEALLIKAESHASVVMPGYTHMQPGKPTTFAHFCLAYFDSLSRDTSRIFELLRLYDLCPLGAVESFGTSWPIDRDFTKDLLGFSRVWEVPQDAISNRGIFQLELLSALNLFTLHTGKLATDLLLYSTFEYNMVEFGSEVAERLHPITGSSVMAQKKNPDALELVRSIAPQLTGLVQSVSGLLGSLPTGYNRDSREVKEYMGLGLQKAKSAAAAMHMVIQTLSVNKKRMEEMVIANFSLTTDLADYLAQVSGAPYRKMYKVVGALVDSLMKEGKSLSTIKAADLVSALKAQGIELELSDDTLSQTLAPQQALQRRKHVGGTNSETTLAMCTARLGSLEALRTKVAAKESLVASAKKKTAALAAGII